jgi:hypothetical protein
MHVSHRIIFCLVKITYAGTPFSFSVVFFDDLLLEPFPDIWTWTYQLPSKCSISELLYIKLPPLYVLSCLFARDDNHEFRNLATVHPFFQLSHDLLDIRLDLIVGRDHHCQTILLDRSEVLCRIHASLKQYCVDAILELYVVSPYIVFRKTRLVILTNSFTTLEEPVILCQPPANTQYARYPPFRASLWTFEESFFDDDLAFDSDLDCDIIADVI